MRSSPAHRTPSRPSAAARRTGYLVTVLIEVIMLGLIHLWPGWESVPFLTAQTGEVLTPVNASLVAGIVANLLYTITDPPWLRAAGDIVVTAVGLVAILAVWSVFPFDFTGQSFDWALVVRVLLVVAVVGSAISIVVSLVRLMFPGSARR
ncbi:hypothetical protein [Myceligenerans indicum]|uniref:Uncharacterized protein n=1 Tax=Myceligenerans indicum TaxID=2593663 RepID=A0ABS1LJ80_9MICO|nr:hypothetical protein [Myceligenerans indicum]MBL0886281.1 hypothetical protein [Myceligenerans indicum]